MYFTDRNLQAIQTLRKQNYSYASIAKALEMNPNTVKSICRRNFIDTPDIPRKTKAEKQMLQICKHCGKPIDNPWNRVKKTFCSDNCRTLYWNEQKKQARLARLSPEKRKAREYYLAINDPMILALERAGLQRHSELSSELERR